jgi:ribonuclease J
VVVSLSLEKNGDIADDPQIFMRGLPEADADGDNFIDIITDEIYGVIESLPRKSRGDHTKISEACRRAIRSVIYRAWGKKPVCAVHLRV